MIALRSAALAATFMLSAGTAMAADSMAPKPADQTPAVVLGQHDNNNASAPVPGKNSFTEAQARARLEEHGYKSVSPLKQDDQSVWRGKAMKDAKSVDVAVDYQGNIVGR